MKQPQLSVDLAPHEQQLGKYRLVAKLGQGGMGTVYLALASGLGSFRKLLVVKELRSDLPWRESSLSMFLDEAQLAARLDHPNVLQTFEAGEANGRYFLAMEYLDGHPLSSLIDHAVPLELHVYILCEVLQGLQYAHELTDYDGTSLHVVHRDVSPQNVFITHHGQVKVVDFGVAKANIGSNITSPGVFKGKFAYAAPEQLLGRPVDGRCDVFAVGVMLWEAIANRRFGVPKPTVDAFRVRTQGLEPKVSQVAPEVDPLLAEICDHALAVDPLQRVESAEALRARLQEWLLLQGEHIQAKQLAAFMHDRFSEERVHRRRVIERAMVDAGASQSVIATLPRELLERESGLSPRVGVEHEGTGASTGIEHDAQHPSSSGISPSPRAHSHQAQPTQHGHIQLPPAQPTQLGQRHDAEASRRTGSASVALPYEPEAQAEAAHARRASADPKLASRLSSAAVLLTVATGVFLVTYQLSRRATEPPGLPQLRSAQDAATAPTVTSYLPATEPAPSAPKADSALSTDSATRPQTRETTFRDRPEHEATSRDSISRDSALHGFTSRDSTRDPALRDSARDSTSREPVRDPALRGSARDSLSREATRDSLSREATRDSALREATRSSAVRDSSSRAAGVRESGVRDGRGAPGQTMSAETASGRTLRGADSVAGVSERAPQRAAAAAAPPPTASVVAAGTSKLTVRDFNPATDGDSAAKAARPHPAPAGTTKSRAGSSSSRTDTGMGSDLRQLRSNGPMRIDTEDPYQ